jgi:hypothetical protein
MRSWDWRGLVPFVERWVFNARILDDVTQGLSGDEDKE